MSTKYLLNSPLSFLFDGQGLQCHYGTLPARRTPQPGKSSGNDGKERNPPLAISLPKRMTRKPLPPPVWVLLHPWEPPKTTNPNGRKFAIGFNLTILFAVHALNLSIRKRGLSSSYQCDDCRHRQRLLLLLLRPASVAAVVRRSLFLPPSIHLRLRAL